MTIVVIGAGPAGLAAAASAAERDAEVILIDDNPSPGGQIWRGEGKATPRGVRAFLQARVVSASQDAVTIEGAAGASKLPFDKLILASGARELFLPFPGWTLPFVMGAGGLQALVKSGLPIAGKRVVVAGSGPLLLAVAAYLKKRGARVPLIAEQAPWSSLIGFATGLPPTKWLEAMRLWSPVFSPGTWITSANPGQIMTNRGAVHSCDYLAVGYGLVSNTELTELLGVEAMRVDEFQRTTIPHIYCAGEMTGTGGVDLSIAEGRIAGFAAAGREAEARQHFGERARWQRFARRLARAFALRPDLKSLAKPDTFVCRCEDVSYSAMSGYSSWREAKLQARCGMGPCQGRVCGPAAEFLFGWRAESVRAPVFPARVGTFIAEDQSLS